MATKPKPSTPAKKTPARQGKSAGMSQMSSMMHARVTGGGTKSAQSKGK